MPRALPTELETAMDNGAFNAYFAIGKRNYTGTPPASLAGYTTLITSILYYKYDGLQLEVKYFSPNLPEDDGLILGDKYYIERGITLAGSNYTIKSAGLRFDDYDIKRQVITAKFSLFSALARPEAIPGDDTYENILTILNPNDYYLGTIDLKPTAENPNHWDYKFYAAGRQISLKNYASLLPLLQQKYLIHAVDNSDDDNENEIQFFHLGNTQSLGDWENGVNPSTDKGGVSVCYSPELNLFVSISGANGAGSKFYTSPDGINWTEVDDPSNTTYNKIRWFPALALFVAVGSDILTSPDGTTWTNQTPANSTTIRDICWSDTLELLVAVSSNFAGIHNIQTSPDGINWTEQTHAAGALQTVTYSPELDMLVAAGTGIFTSTNGTAWTKQNAFAGLLGSTWSPELALFVLCGNGTSGIYIFTSPDGINWTNQTPSAARSWNAIVWASEMSLLIAVCSDGTGGQSMTSPNGVTWTAKNTPQDAEYRDICWAAELELFVAVAGPTIRYNIHASSISNTADHTIEQGDITLRKKGNIARFIWRDENESIHTSGIDTSILHNLGYLESTDEPPSSYVNSDRASVIVGIHLKYKSGDIFTLQIDENQTATYMAAVTEIMDPSANMGWRCEIELLERFGNTDGGPLPSTIERVAAYTPLVTTNFNRFLTTVVNNLQALADFLDDYALSKPIADALYSALGHTHSLVTEDVQDIVGAMVSSNTETGITVTYDDSSGKLNLVTDVIESDIREKLTGNRTYYIRKDGSDSNNGLTDSAGGAFLTLAKAKSTCQQIDLAGYTVTLKLGIGTWTETLTLENINGNIVLEGTLDDEETVTSATVAAGTGATRGTVTKTGAFTGNSYTGYLCYFVTDNAYRVISSNTNDALTLVGTAPSSTTQDVIVYSWDTIIDGSATFAMRVLNQNSFTCRYLSFTTSGATAVELNGCINYEIDYCNFESAIVITAYSSGNLQFSTCDHSTTNAINANNGVCFIFGCQINTSAATAIIAQRNGIVGPRSGTEIIGATNGIMLQDGGLGILTNTAGVGYVRVTNCGTYGIRATTGGQATGTTNTQYASNGTNESVDATSFGYID